MTLIALRMTILEETTLFGVFGRETFQQQLDEAYKDFRSFLKLNKLRCSQPRFTPGLAAWFFRSMA